MHGMKKNYVMTAIILLFLAGCSTDVKESDIKFAGETGLDAIKVTNWNLANKVVTLAYFQGKMNFFGNCFPKKQSDNKRVTSNPKKHKKISQPCHHFLYLSIRMILQSHLFLFSPSGALVAISP